MNEPLSKKVPLTQNILSTCFGSDIDNNTIIGSAVGGVAFLIISITTIVIYRSYLARKYPSYLAPNPDYEVCLCHAGF